jgi:hypothetical protein
MDETKKIALFEPRLLTDEAEKKILDSVERNIKISKRRGGIQIVYITIDCGTISINATDRSEARVTVLI